MSENKLYDCLIIGAGPAGLTAAIYCQRAGLETAFFEKDTPGGKMSKTSIIENYPGFESIKGYEISLKMLNQAIKSGSKHYYGNIVSIDKKEGAFYLKTEDNKTYQSKTVVIATGMKEKKLDVLGEDKFFNNGISYCAICDGALFKNKDVAVIGGGNSAFEEAIYLSQIVNKIYLIHRNENFRAEQTLINRVFENKKIEVIKNTEVKSFNGNKNLNSISIINVKDNIENIIQIEGAFIFIGFKPETKFINSDLIKKEEDFIITNENMETSIEGLYSVGDVNKKKYRQISTAVSDGTIAALNIKKYLDKKL